MCMYEPDCEPDYTCYSCEEAEKKMDHAQDFMKGIVGILYGSDQIDIDDLEWYLSEVCDFLKVRLPLHQPNLQRKSSSLIMMPTDTISRAVNQ